MGLNLRSNHQIVFLSLLLFNVVVVVVQSQSSTQQKQTILKMLARWCCVNEKEYEKCMQWKLATDAYNKSSVILDCVLGNDKFDCYKKIFEDQADLMTADAGELYTAGKYYNLVPLSTEVYSAGASGTHSGYYAVAVVKRNSGMTMDRLKGANSCHGGVGTSAGWNVPISTLIEKKMLEIVDCNNHVKAATKFFNRMCAPDALNQQFNPTGDNPTSACELCTGKIGSTFCTNQDPYAGQIGALYCLNDGGGDVAFVKHTSVNEWAALNKSININDYELLCPNRTNANYPYPTASINDYTNCNWGQVPPRTILASGRKALQQKRDYKEFLKLSAKLFSGKPGSISNQQTIPQQQFTYPPLFTLFPQQPQQQNQTTQGTTTTIQPLPQFYLFDSSIYFGRDLIFIDQTVSFEDLDDSITYLSFLNTKAPDYLNKILKLYECPLRLVRWCVISNFEKDKCRLMKNAFASRNIKPDIDCVSGKNTMECMSMIKNRLADLITVDPADAFRATRYYGLNPLAAEDYGTIDEQDKPVYYAVAAVKKTDLSTNLWNLRTKRMCGTAFGDMSGWHVPVAYLIGIKELYVTDCRISKVAGEYFGRSCIPGAQDYDYNTLKTNPRALCLACYSKGADYCSRSHKEYYYGDTGAFRCINEGRGDVAFVRHTSVKLNTDGRNTDQWARPLRQTDFELLCKDGTRKSVEKYRECHLMKVPSRIIMIAGHRTDIQRSYLWNMLNFAQQLFGSDTNSDFTMFESMKEHPDLIFNDATVKLVEVNQETNEYLGSDVIAMLERTDDRICNRATGSSNNQIYTLIIVFIIQTFILFKN